MTAPKNIRQYLLDSALGDATYPRVFADEIDDIDIQWLIAVKQQLRQRLRYKQNNAVR